MLRLLLGIATPVAALGLAAGYVGPTLVPGEGEPMLVSSAQTEPNVEKAAYDGSACLALALGPNVGTEPSGAGPRSDVLVVNRPTETFALVLRGTDQSSRGAQDVLIVWSRDRILAIRQAPAKKGSEPDALPAFCAPDNDTVSQSRI